MLIFHIFLPDSDLHPQQMYGRANPASEEGVQVFTEGTMVSLYVKLAVKLERGRDFLRCSLHQRTRRPKISARYSKTGKNKETSFEILLLGTRFLL